MIIYKNCKYMLPCGWCELRERMCPANEPSIAECRKGTSDVINVTVECKGEGDD